MPHPLLSLDATAQIQAMAMKRISAVELLTASLRRADQVNAEINAVVARDPERAMLAARVIDERRAAGDQLGPLAGLPMTIKDSIDVNGMPASAGLPHLLNRLGVDAAAVARVRDADAVIWGKTNTPVLAGDVQTYNGLYGTTSNPWNLERTSGGSSGGAAAALAAGVTALEVGSDIGGSLRIPASFCGVFAHKPTLGLVEKRGHVPPMPGFLAEDDLSVVGPMARSARDLRLLLSVIARAPIPSTAPVISLRDLRIGVWMDDPLLLMDAEVERALDIFVDGLVAEGATVWKESRPVSSDTLLRAYFMLMLPLIAMSQSKAERLMYAAALPFAEMALAMGAGPRSNASVIRAYRASHRQWLVANEQRARLSAVMDDAFHRMDVLICPCAPVPAIPHDHRPLPLRSIRLSSGKSAPYLSLLDWSALPIVCGLPSTAIPIGQTPDGLPVGIQIIGPKGGDSRTIAVAEAIEHALGGFVAPPPFKR